jgi:hypothetical protein
VSRARWQPRSTAWSRPFSWTKVRPAIEYLEAASRVTAEGLRERFDDERRRQ